jgi:chromosome segregation ATPase
MNKLTFFFLLLHALLLSQETNSNDEINRKLDLIINKLSNLDERVTEIEIKSGKISKDLKAVEKKAEEAKTLSENKIALPQNEEEKKSFMSKLRIELKSEEAKARGAWTKKETWKGMRRNLTEYKVRMLLGNPNSIKGSLNPRIERVYNYHGDLDADGIEEKGLVNFYNGKSVSFESPFE